MFPLYRKALFSKIIILLFIFSLLGQHMPFPSIVSPVEAFGTRPISDLAIGDRVDIAPELYWEWEHKTGNKYTGEGVTKSVKWIVVAHNHYSGGFAGSVIGGANHVTLMAEELIGLYPFDNSTNVHGWGNNNWGETGTHSSAENGLRPWLNSTGIHSEKGFYREFSDVFKNYVLTTNVPNRVYSNGNYYQTSDKVFIASQTELAIGNSLTYEIGNAFPYFENGADIKAQLGGDNHRYWLRSPQSGQNCFVRKIGATGNNDRDRAYRAYIGVRPVINVRASTPVTIEPGPEGAYMIQGEEPENTTTYPELAYYSLNSGQNIDIVLNLNGKVLEKISDGRDLIEGTHYTVNHNVYTILSNYLDTKKAGKEVILTFKMAGEESNPQTVIYITPNDIKAIGNLNLGDKVVDKTWSWVHKTGSNYTLDEGDADKPVTWVVAAKNHYSGGDAGSLSDEGRNHVTLITEELIGMYAFDDSTNRGSTHGNNHWGNSGMPNAARGIRPFLNNVFYGAISAQFQNAVLGTDLPNREWEEGNIYTTTDKIFLPSQTELGGGSIDSYAIGLDWGYFTGNDSRKVYLKDETFRYWSRSPDSSGSRYVRHIHSDGSFRDENANIGLIGLRPAVNIKNDLWVTVEPNEEGVFEVIQREDAMAYPKVAFYTLNSGSDIVITLFSGHRELQRISDGDGNLIRNTNYRVNDKFYTIRSNYLESKEAGKVTLTFEMDGGENPTVDIIISPSNTRAIGTLEIGDRIVDSSGSWRHRTGNDYTGSGADKPINWIVVAKDHYEVEGEVPHVTLMSEEVIGKYTFDNSTNVHVWGNGNWKESGAHATASRGLRPWLNTTFFSNFSEEFQDAIVKTTVPNKKVGDVFYTTEDRVFIPSQTELGGGTTRTYEIGEVYPFFEGAENDARKARLGNTDCMYWTRSPKLDQECLLRKVDIAGEFSNDRANRSYVGVRPVINLRADIPMSDEDGVFEIADPVITERIPLATGDLTGDGKENVVATFDFGTWYWDWDDGWERLTTSTAEILLTADITGDGKDNVLAKFDFGLFYWDEGWIRLTTSNALLVTTGDITGDGKANPVVTFDFGTFYWDEGWERLTTSTAEILLTADITGDDKDNVLAKIGGSTWYWNEGWISLTTSDVLLLTTGDLTGDGKENVVATFDFGTFYWDAGWIRLTTSTALILATGDMTGDGKENVVATFNFGTFYWDAGWTRLTTSTAEMLLTADITGDGKFNPLAKIGGSTWYWDEGWIRLTTSNVLVLTTGDITGDGKANPLASLDFGTFYWDAGWTRLTTSTVKYR